MAKEAKYKLIQSSVPREVFLALEAMAEEAELTLDQLIESLLTELVADDKAAHGKTA